MNPAINQFQTWREAGHGSRLALVGDRGLPAASEIKLGRVAQDGAHVYPGVAGTQKVPAVVARAAFVATGAAHSISIARGVPAAERRPVHVLPDTGRRAASPTLRLAQNSAALLTSCGRSKPSGINPNGFQPAIEPHLNLRLSSLASFEKQRSERANGTVLYPSGEFPKTSGDQHESR